MALTREALRTYLNGKTRADLGKIGDDEPLFSSGTVDSFAMVDLLVFLEKHTGSRLGPEDITFDNLDTVTRILAFADARTKK